jgi:hypothetical protein
MKIPKKLPYLWQDNIDNITVTNGKGEIEDGHEVYKTIYTGPCNFSQTSKKIQNKEGLWVPLAGVIHIKGDIDTTSDVISCKVNINGNEYRGNGHKIRNPDGSINHVRIDLEG